MISIMILYSQQKQDWELTVVQIRNSLLQNSDLNWRKQGKQLGHSGMTYDYTVEVKNRFKGLILIDKVPDELWMEVCDTVQEVEIKTYPQEKEMQKDKMVVWGCLTNSWEKKRS